MINKIGFGAWQIGGSNIVNGSNMGWKDVDEEEAILLVRAAYSLGIRFFDTSNAYGQGQSERILGKALKDKEDVVFTTKYGPVYQDGAMMMDFSPSNMRRSLEGSLKRLNTSSVDFFMLHSPKPEDINVSVINALEQLKTEGIIKNAGLSVSFIKPYIENIPYFDAFELLYNSITEGNLEFLPLLQNKKVFFRSIFASGLLLKSNQFLMQKDKLVDWRKNLPAVLVDKIQQLPEEERTYANVLNSALMHPVEKIIIGVNKQKHLSSLNSYLEQKQFLEQK